MKKLFPVLLFASLGWAAIGCKTQVEDKYTASIDSIADVLNAAQKAATVLDKKELEEIVPQYNAYYDFFKNEYDDLSNAEFYTHELDDMQRCRKYAKKTLGNLDGWKAELDKTINQLNTLKADYSNGLLSEEEVKIHLNTEAQAAYQVNHDIQKYLGLASSCMRNFEALSIKLDSAKTAFLATHE